MLGMIVQGGVRLRPYLHFAGADSTNPFVEEEAIVKVWELQQGSLPAIQKEEDRYTCCELLYGLAKATV